MFDVFMINALLAGCGVALITGVLGCFVVWRRMAYFGDATSHAAILGVALALMFDWPIVFGTLLTATVMVLGISYLGRAGYTNDTLLGVFSHGALATGLIIAALTNSIRWDLSAFLFGDILAIARSDIVLIYVGAALIVGMIIWRWSRLLCATLSEELSYSMGINPQKEKFFITLALAILVAVALKIIGALLITAMLIIPATAARGFTKSPESMAIISVVIGLVSVFAGLRAADFLDAAAGPNIICVTIIFFILSLVWRRLFLRA